MNSFISKLLSQVNKTTDIVEKKTRKVGHEPTPQKKIRTKYSKLTNKQQKFAERKSKNRRKMEFQSRKINRLRGVG